MLLRGCNSTHFLPAKPVSTGARFAPACTPLATSKRPVYAVAVGSHFKASFCIGIVALCIAQRRAPTSRHTGFITSAAMASRTDVSASHNKISVLVLHADKILLASQTGYPQQSYALLQGSLQQGEQQHEAAVRISRQQAGIAIHVSSIIRMDNQSNTFCAQTSQLTQTDGASGLTLLQGKARDCANEVRLKGHEVDTVLGNPPPQLQLDKALLADAKWFNKRWLTAFNQGAAPKSPFSFFPGEGGEARRTITSWVDQVKSESPLDLTPDVAIDTGVFKYVLLVVTDTEEGRSKLIVRGDRQSGYHVDVFEKTVRELAPYKLHVAEPLGGGRIRHDDGSKTISIYGYSSAYGQAPHDLSAAIVRQWYPMYAPDKITVSYEGY
ncbi:hypothetical protein WJX77_006441 [Trebouxia sp. C0004]